MTQIRREAEQSNALDTIQLGQSQAQIDIQNIIKKYGGASADATWANELSAMEK